MTDYTISCVVEGHGDARAVPVLVRHLVDHWRSLGGLGHVQQVDVVVPQRVPRTKILKKGEVERAVRLAAARLGSSPGGVLVLVDADDDCPKALGPEMLRRARLARSDVPAAVVLANREYEAWFLASAVSMAGRRGLPAALELPVDPETVQGAKEWLSSRMPPDRSYSETVDQPALSACIDVPTARRRSPSFDKLCREVERLLAPVTQAGA